MSDLVDARRNRFMEALGHAPFDAFLSERPSTIEYITGYHSVTTHLQDSPLAVVVTSRGTTLVSSAADVGPAQADRHVHVDELVQYGEFYFEGGREVASYADYPTALKRVLGATALGSSRLGVEGRTMRDGFRTVTERGEFRDAPHWLVDGEAWMESVRRSKLPGEVELIEAAAALASKSIDLAIERGGVGITERELAVEVSRCLSSAGAIPLFTVVTSGPRSALADTLPIDRAVQVGDLVRFDVSGWRHGYWYDVGRTAVVGEPTREQQLKYRAIYAGQDAEIAVARPGVLARDVYKEAVSAVECEGIAPYRRHHCGHGIGMDVYERPIISSTSDVELCEGMTVSLETPYYEIGWGGMMVEDTFVITGESCRRLSNGSRGLRVLGSSTDHVKKGLTEVSLEAQ